MATMSSSGIADLGTQSQPSSRAPQLRDGGSIVIGFVNNMPDAALRTTERQFRELLAAASPNTPIRLRFFSLPELSRSEAGLLHIRQNYENIGDLWAGGIDGLIVTGTEPREPDLTREPYWASLTKLMDWTEEHAVSTVWSCLAAHAVALYTDGIKRRALPEKLSGLFDCIRVADHAIVAGAPSRWRVPHSRYNELPEEALVSKSYRILSRSPDAAADIFVKQRRALFIFIQGHPEYDPGALLREYRRDVGRFLARERDSYPEMPRGYFDQEDARLFLAFRERALRSRSSDLLSSFPAAEAERRLGHPWRGAAICIYANWLSYLVEQRCRTEGGRSNNSRQAYRDPKTTA
jgi:homoserine O-succinyltransferase/O-acetyltransferase